MEQEPPKELIDWWNQVCEIGIAPSRTPRQKSLFIRAHRQDATFKDFRCLDQEQAESGAQRLRDTGQWASVEIVLI